ncbi:MAG: hypothetical protein ACRC57_00795, partial [Sarcina sp.]
MKKISKIVAGTVAIASVGAVQAIPKVRESEVNLGVKATEFFGVSDVNITPSEANTNVIVDGDTSNVNSNTKVIWSNSTVTYEIPYNVVSKNGKSFNIPNITATANPTLNYSDGSDASIAEGMQKQITYTDIAQTGQTSTSSGIIKISFKVPQTGVAQVFNPHITLHCGSQNIPVNLPNINTDANYNVGISTYLQVSNNQVYISMGTQYEQSPRKYNPYGHTMTSMTFSLSQNDVVGSVKYIPISNPDLIVNSNGTYTVKGALLKDFLAGKGEPLFNISKNNNGVISTINVNPVSATWNGIEENHPHCSISTYGHSTSYNKAPNSDNIGQGEVQMTQTNSSSMTGSGDKVTFASTINSGIKGNWTGVTFNYIQDGYTAALVNGIGSATPNLNYVNLDQAGLNIMNSGTPEQKYNLLQAIYNAYDPNTRDPITFQYGTIYNSTIMNNCITNGTMVVTEGSFPNFTNIPIKNSQLVFTNPYTINNGSTTENSNSVTAVPNTANSSIVSKTFTLGVNNGGNVDSNNFSGLTNIDYVNSSSTGFMMGANNEYTPNYVNGHTDFFNQGSGQSIMFRTGLASYNTSSVKGSSWQGSWPTIDGETTQTQQISWLSSSHKIIVSMQRDSAMGGGSIDPNSKIVLNLGAPAELTGPLTLSGGMGEVTVPASDYAWNKAHDQITINKIPNSTFPLMTRNLNASIPVQYDPADDSMTSITVSGQLIGPKDNPTGNVYQINTHTIPGKDIMGDSYNYGSGTATVYLTPTVNNDCLHTTNGVNANNVATMTDMVHNSSTSAKQYIVVGQIVAPGTTSSLPGNFGEPSVGGLGATLEGFNNPDCPVYVLPESALSNTDSEGYTNQEIMEGTNPFQMKGAKAWIENPASGWVKYTPGMSLKGMVGYTYMPTIKGGESWKTSYNIKLTNVNGQFQYGTSQYKYFDTTDGVGSASNIVIVSPAGENPDYSWTSNVILQESPGNTRALTQQELNTPVTFNSVNGKQTETLGYLISHGADKDGQFDPTPAIPEDHLQQEVDLANDEAGLKAAGYELVGVKVKVGDGAWTEEGPDFFTNTGISTDNKLTQVLFIIKQIVPKYQDSVSVTLNGAPIPAGSALLSDTKNHIPNQTGNDVEAGKETGLSTPTQPNGYKITGVKVVTTNSSGVVISTTDEPSTFTVPTQQGNANVHYIYNLVPVVIPKVTDKVTVKYQSTGDAFGTPQSITGEPKASTNLKTPTLENGMIPKGYHIVSITSTPDGITTPDYSGTGNNTYTVPTTLGNKDNNIVYTIAPDKATLNVTVNELGPDGKTITKVLENKVQTVNDGHYGEQVGTNGNYEKGIIPNGYKIESITYNNKPVTQGALGTQTLGSGDNSVVYNLVPDSATLTTTVVNDATGKVIATLPTQSGTTGEAYNKANYMPTGVDMSNNTYTQTVDGNVEHFKIVKVTNQVNNETANDITKDTSSLANDKLLGNDKVVYHVVPEYHDSVVVNIYNPTTGKYEQVTDVTAKNYDGKNLEPQNVKNPVYNVSGAASGVTTPVAPKGYKITGVTVTTTKDGKTTTVTENGTYTVPTTLGDSDVKVTYNMAPIGDVTTQVIVQGEPDSKLNQPQTIAEPDTVIDSKKNIDINNYKVPAGYHLVKTTIQTPSDKTAKEINPSDVDQTNLEPGTTHVVYTIAKNVSDSVNITYVTGNGKTEKVVVPAAQVDSNVTPGSKKEVTLTIPKGYQLAPNTSENPNATSSVTTGKTTSANTSLNIDNNSVTVTTPSSDDTASSVNITIHLDKIVHDTVNVEVQNPDGTITKINEANANNYAGGSNLAPQDTATKNPNGIDGESTGLNTPVAPNGYHIVKVISQNTDPITNVSSPEVPESTSYKVPNLLGTEDNATTYTIAPNSASLNVTVNVEGQKTPLEPTTTTISNKDGYYNEVIGTKGEPNTTVQQDIKDGKYKVVGVTLNGEKISLTTYQKDIASGKLKSGVNSVVYDLAPVKGIVKVSVVTEENGKTVVVVPENTVQDANVGTSLSGYQEPQLPAAYKGYHLVKTTIQVPNGKVVETTQKELGSDKVVEGTTQIVYTIAKDSTAITKVTYVTPDGKIVPGTETTTVGNPTPAGGKTDITIKVPKGYHIVTTTPITNNGQAVPNVVEQDGKTFPVTTGGTPEKAINNNVKITVAPNPATLHVTVNEMGPDGKVVTKTIESKTTVPNGVYGEAVGTNGNYETSIIPKGYKIESITYNGNSVTQSELPGKTLASGENKVVYNLVPDSASLTTTVVNDATGKVIATLPTQSGTTGEAYNKANYMPTGVDMSNDTYTQTVNGKVEHFKIVKVTNQINNETANDITKDTSSLATDKLLGNDKVVYHVVPAYHDSVIVNVLQPDGTYKEVTENIDGSENTAPQNGAYNVNDSASGIKTPVIPKDYKIDSITVYTTVDGKTTTQTIPTKDLSSYKVPNQLKNNDVKIVYNISQQGSVTVQVNEQVAGEKTPVVITKEHTVDTANVGESIKNTGITVEKGCHIVNATLNGNIIKGTNGQPLTSVSDITSALSKDKIVNGVQHVVYTIAKNATSTTSVTYETPNGQIVPGTKVTSTTVPAGSPSTVTITPPKGYHLVPENPVTDNGTVVTPKDGKISVNTGTPDKGKNNNVIIKVEKNITNKVTYTIVTNDGTTLTPVTTINGDVAPGTPVSDSNIKLPVGYQLVPVAQNPITGNTGKVTYTNKDGVISLTTPTSDNENKEVDTHIKIVVEKIPYTTKITVTTPNGKEVPGIPAKTVTTPAGDTVTGTGITVPKGYKIVKVTVDNKPVEPTATTGNANVPAITHT